MAQEKFYRWQNGKQRALSSREVKQYIMRANNWTATEYQKQYDIFKNKLRAYESYQEAQGAPTERQSVVSVLFKEAKAKKQYGANYTPSRKMQQIRSFSAYSITKGRKQATRADYLAKQNENTRKYLQGRFGLNQSESGFISKNAGAKAIVDAFKEQAERTGEPINYAKMETALADYANKVHATIDEKDAVQDSQAIPFGETAGSGDEVDFDIDSYL